MKNIFTPEVTQEVIDRINQLSPSSKGLWGKMNVGQMLAHCCVTYEMIYTDKHPKPGFFKKMLIKALAKNAVVSEKPYPKNGRTAPQFVMVDEKDFDAEKKRLIDYLKKTQELGADYFHNKESHSFGPLTKQEWNNMFYKHLDHHLQQFGV